MKVRKYRAPGLRGRGGFGALHARLSSLHKAQLGKLMGGGSGGPVGGGTGSVGGLGTMYGMPREGQPVSPSNTSGRPVAIDGTGAPGLDETGDPGQAGGETA